MKMKTLLIAAVASVALAVSAEARTRTVQTSNGTVARSGRYHGGYYRGGSRVSIGFGFGYPGFYGGYYGGYPGYYGGYCPYYGGGYYSPGGYNGYYGGGYYPNAGYGYNSGYGYNGGYSQGGYASRGNVVAQVQSRLARAGYYRGAIDGVMGPRTRYAIRAYEGRHGLPIDGVIDRRLLATLGLA